MADEYTEESSQSWFSRLADSIKGVPAPSPAAATAAAAMAAAPPVCATPAPVTWMAPS